MNENLDIPICEFCNDSGYIAWFLAKGPQGIGRAIVPPNINYPASELIFEACDCESGKKFYTIIS